MACPCGHAGRRYETLDRQCLDRKSRRSLAGGLACRCERAGKLRSDTSRTGTHRLLSRLESVLSCAVKSCRGQSARAIRRRLVSGHYRNRPSETQTTSATIKQQVARMSEAIYAGWAPTKTRISLKAAFAYLGGTVSSMLGSYANRADAVSECSGM
jgi:hypothetical protein